MAERLLGNGPELWDKLLEVLRPIVGYEAVIAGGCLRDHALNLTPKDIDVFALARNEQQMAGWVRVLNALKGEITFELTLKDYKAWIHSTELDNAELDEYSAWAGRDLIGCVEGRFTVGHVGNTFDLNIVCRKDLSNGAPFLVDNFDMDVVQQYYPDENLIPQEGRIYQTLACSKALARREVRFMNGVYGTAARWERFNKRNPGVLTYVHEDYTGDDPVDFHDL